MAKKKKSSGSKLQDWIQARKRHHLSHAQVQMARELGMNPNNLGKIDNHKQESWKVPLPQYIEYLYEKQFNKTYPDEVSSIEEKIRQKKDKKAAKRESKSQIPEQKEQKAQN